MPREQLLGCRMHAGGDSCHHHLFQSRKGFIEQVPSLPFINPVDLMCGLKYLLLAQSNNAYQQQNDGAIFLNFRNPALEDQACDRIYRVGQQKDVTIHRSYTAQCLSASPLAFSFQELWDWFRFFMHEDYTLSEKVFYPAPLVCFVWVKWWRIGLFNSLNQEGGTKFVLIVCYAWV